jgi:restriction system protein
MSDNSFTGTSIAGDDYVEQMTPTEFEETVYKYIAELGQNLPGFKVAHNTRVTGNDGIYQADILASYTALNVNMMVLIECKHYTAPVNREKIQILNDKLRSTGAHKGILFSTSGFQSGAIDYALRHKIALVRLLTSRFEMVTNTLAKPKRPVYAPPAPLSYIGELYAADRMSYIANGKISALVAYCL